ncbi:hypothetical protein FEM48_Zijuj01G0068600 [Ziziphus jujuba var. spinosa]|uniref:Uncharacterized protein n=1 Tax=Ziziphus jujuba var. spinosa TaxID=714518 RepID=A0A978VZR6_ZIZJJ|nr:hypothetical protein FEM48_Zijuj01G0068600 [Ziziphus jujuba var. spinosa]
MELDQLLQNASRLRQRNACIYPFDLDLLRDAFHMRETTPVYQPFGSRILVKTAQVLVLHFEVQDLLVDLNVSQGIVQN